MPELRSVAEGHFAERGIVWHRHAAHGLSSQACCLNFLMPLAHRPELLSSVIGSALGIEPPQMLPINRPPDEPPLYIDFEWTGSADYLDEWPKSGRATRGANATSADAVVRFQDGAEVRTVLIEWKYTESYGAPLVERGNPTRRLRYTDKLFAPEGPIRADADVTLDDFFYEPLYQLVRQQMLAWRMERAREDGADRVTVLHLSPAGNRTLHRVTSPRLRERGDDVFEVFRSLLAHPDDFTGTTIERAFRPVLTAGHADPAIVEWAAYLRRRYSYVNGTA
ncbi:MAG: hypothetical protein RLO08_13915 [Parvibaculaceae bacterium]